MTEDELRRIHSKADDIVDRINEPRHISAMEIEAFIAEDLSRLFQHVAELRKIVWHVARVYPHTLDAPVDEALKALGETPRAPHGFTGEKSRQ